MLRLKHPNMLKMCKKNIINNQGNRIHVAEQHFNHGYGCAQSILLAFDDMIPLNKESAINIAAPFNGGMGEARSICGALSGALMLIGLIEGKKHTNLTEKHHAIRHKSNQFIQMIKTAERTLNCPDILKQSKVRKENIHKKCNSMVKSSVEALEHLISD